MAPPAAKGGGAPPASKPRQSGKIMMFNNLRWACYLFFPIVGFLITLLGVLLALVIFLNVGDFEPAGAFGVIIAGALITYVAIYFNKRS